MYLLSSPLPKYGYLKLKKPQETQLEIAIPYYHGRDNNIYHPITIKKGKYKITRYAFTVVSVWKR
jgi:hypothetical protein